MILTKVIDWSVEIPVLKAFKKTPVIISHVFPIEFENKLSIWRMECCFKHDIKAADSTEPDFMSLFLNYVSGDVDYEVEGEFSIIHHESKNVLYGPLMFRPRIFNDLESSRGYEVFISFSELSDLNAKSDIGTVCFHVKIRCNDEGPITSPTEDVDAASPSVNVKNETFFNTSTGDVFEMMFMHPFDMTIKTSDGFVLKANEQIITEKSKIIEICRDRRLSPLGIKLEPSENLEIDCNRATLIELWRFIYQGVLKNAETMSITRYNDFLEAATKYQIEGLFDYCINTIKKNFKEFEVLKIVELAESHNIPSLFDKCCKHIQSSYDRLSIIDDWKNLSDALKLKILDKLTKEACSKKVESVQTFLRCKRSYSSMIKGIEVDKK